MPLQGIGLGISRDTSKVNPATLSPQCVAASERLKLTLSKKLYSPHLAAEILLHS